jgi:hypothetical protein
MSRSWIKLHTSLLDHAGLGRLPDSTRLIYVEALLLAGRTDDDGRVGPLEDVAWALRRPVEAVEAAIADLGGRLAVIDGEVYVRDWNDYQAKPPSAASEAVRERVAGYRGRVSAGNEAATTLHGGGNEVATTLHDAGNDIGNADVTPLEGEVEGETEREAEARTEPHCDAVASRARANGRNGAAAHRQRPPPSDEDPVTAHAQAFAATFHLDPATAVRAKQTLIWGHARRCADAGATVAEWTDWVAEKKRERTSDRRLVWGTILKAHNAAEAFLCERDAQRAEVRPRDSEGDFAQ